MGRSQTSAEESRGAPLAGVRIIAVEQYGAGPFGTMYLADLGAEVVKIEDPGSGGDIARYVPPLQSEGDSLFFEAFNRNKRSLALDLKTQAGRQVFERLVTTADAVVSNLRGDQAHRLGLTYADLEQFNPRIVCVSLTGYGEVGPQAAYPGYDALVQAEAGWASLTGGPDDPPTKTGLSLADYIAGLTSAIGLLATLLDTRRTGRGRDVSTNLYDAALSMLSYPATWFLSAGNLVQRLPMSAHPSITPFQFFATSDGYVAVACAKDKFFIALADGLGLSEMTTDRRFADFASRWSNRIDLVDKLAARFAERSTAEWLLVLRGRVPIGPVRSLEEALDLDELRMREMLVEYEHPSLGRVRSIGLPINVDGHKKSYRRGPQLAEDHSRILTELGYSQDKITELVSGGAFGTLGSSAGVRHGNPDV